MVYPPKLEPIRSCSPETSSRVLHGEHYRHSLFFQPLRAFSLSVLISAQQEFTHFFAERQQVAALDPAPFYDMLEESTRSLRLPGTKPEYFDNDELRTEWNILFPVDQFLKSYSVQLPPQVTESYVSPWGETFKLTAEWSVLNAVRRSRSLKLVLNHPTIMLVFSDSVAKPFVFFP